MADPLDRELLQHAAALRGLARALVGADAAADVVQETALQALRRPPAAPGSWFGWLATALRRRAAVHRRGAVRRQRREAVVPPPEPDPTPLQTAIHRETLARLVDALLALPEPYQGTLLLRFYADLPPAAIAARTGEPLATVKSRLQRGLGLLRERLDAADHGDWRAGLGLALGLPREAAPAAATAGAILSVTTVTTMASKLVVGVVTAAVAVWWWWPAEVAPVPAPASAAAAPGPLAAVAAAPAAEAVDLAADLATAGGGGERVAAAARDAVAFTGRCVDDRGVPVPGLRVVAMTRRWAAPETLGRVETVTASDGRFAAQLPVLPRAFHVLDVRGPAHCRTYAHLDDAVAGARDLGDVVVPRAFALRGRVVDAAGLPQPGVRLAIAPRERPTTAVFVPVVPEPLVVVTDAAGEFASAAVWPATTITIQPTNRVRVPVGSLVVAADAAPFLELVVGPPPPPCRGVVVDPHGTPLAGARVGLDGDEVTTAADGRFALQPDPHWGNAPRRVRAEAADHAPLAAGSWTYGDAAELRLVLQPLPAVELRVLAGATGAPVERFRAELLQHDSWVRPVRAASERHADGRCRLAAPAGRYFARVEPLDGGAPSALLPVELAAGTVSLEVRVWPSAGRTLRVLAAGRPVAGVAVQLLDAGGAMVDAATVATMLDDARVSSARLAHLVQAGTTDAAGRLPLRGPRGPLALRLTGGGLAAQVVQPVHLEAAGELAVVATPAASWRGRLQPASALAALRRHGPALGNLAGEALGVELHAADGRRHRSPSREPFAVAADGSFVIDSAPAGEWALVLVADREFALARAVLRPGQELTQDLDVAPFAPIAVRLRIQVDGAPASGLPVAVRGRHRFGTALSEWDGRADAAGLAAVPCRPGTLLVGVTAPGPGGGEHDYRVVLPEVAVDGAEHLVAVQRGALQLAVAHADGTPAAGVEVEVHQGVDRHGIPLTTDAAGRTMQLPLAAGEYQVLVLPQRLADHGARQALGERQGWSAVEAARLPVGTVRVAPGPPAQVALRLPAAFYH